MPETSRSGNIRHQRAQRIDKDSERFELDLEDFQVGDFSLHWPGQISTEASNESFTLLSMNAQPLHLDEEYAPRCQQGKMLVKASPSAQHGGRPQRPRYTSGIIANLGYAHVTHAAPMFIGDTIYAESSVLSVLESVRRPDRGVVPVETRVPNQRG